MTSAGDSSSLSDVLRTLIINPCSILTGLITHALLRYRQIAWLQLLNPWELPITWWIAGYVAIRIALLGFVDGLCWRLAPRLKQLPSRVGPKPVYQHKINLTDVAYLILNSVIEFIFAQQVGHLLMESPLIIRDVRSLGILNSVVAVWMLLVADDMLYAPLHRFMHHQSVYKWVHKHHHRNTFPARGYIDAANEHPVEQVVAMTLHWMAIHIVAVTTGVHVVAVAAHFGLKALGACFNHTGFDVQFRVLGLEYSVRAHEMHHRKPNTNFAQYVMFWDQLMGTYKPYESIH